MSKTDGMIKQGMNQGAREGKAVPASYKTFDIFFESDTKGLRLNLNAYQDSACNSL